MNDAVARFRARMGAGNRAFLAARVSDLRQQVDIGERDERSAVEAMSHCWFNWREVHSGWKRQTGPQSRLQSESPQISQQRSLEAAVETLNDVTELPHYHMDGTEPPLSETRRARFLSAFEEAVNDFASWELLGDSSDSAADSGASQDQCINNGDERIKAPAELSEFLALTNGVYDADFRHSGICVFSPMSLVGFKEVDDSKNIEQESEMLYSYLDGMTDPERWQEMGPTFINQELDIAAGLFVDEAMQWPDMLDWYSGSQWYSMYAFCRKATCECGHCWDHGEEDSAPQPWGWRVIIYHAKGTHSVDYDIWVFDTIVEFLDWYASWDERLDMEDMRKATSGEDPVEHEEYARVYEGSGKEKMKRIKQEPTHTALLTK